MHRSFELVHIVFEPHYYRINARLAQIGVKADKRAGFYLQCLLFQAISAFK